MKYIIPILRDGDVFNSFVEVLQKGNKTTLIYTSEDVTITAENDFPFFALVDIRLKLEEKKVKLLCNGSRTNVYPSGMSASGFLAYEIKMKEQAQNMVNILDPIKDINDWGTVSEQKEYWNRWLNSLGK